jgi:hypothetical protein
MEIVDDSYFFCLHVLCTVASSAGTCIHGDCRRFHIVSHILCTVAPSVGTGIYSYIEIVDDSILFRMFCVQLSLLFGQAYIKTVDSSILLRLFCLQFTLLFRQVFIKTVDDSILFRTFCLQCE